MYMKKRNMILLMIAIGLALMLAACGEKSQESVITKLDETLGKLEGYKAKAEMKMNTGQTEQQYDVDVWYKDKDFYRVALANEEDEKGNQVILKNEAGVFVITPALNKSFKFQTEWPDNSSQPYLYQSLVHDVKEDKEAVFTATDDHYIFETKTNYQSNNNLPFQEIHFDKKTYTPVQVKVLDKDKEALVEVTFSSFELDPSFGEDDFKTEAQMTQEDVDEEDMAVSGVEQEDSFSVLFPLYTAGAELADKKEVSLDDGERMIMTFSGDKNFTLVQEKMDVSPALSSPMEIEGDIVHLGHAVGALSNNVVEWNYNGVQFYLASEDLTKEELIEVASSVQGREAK